MEALTCDMNMSIPAKKQIQKSWFKLFIFTRAKGWFRRQQKTRKRKFSEIQIFKLVKNIIEKLNS